MRADFDFEIGAVDDGQRHAAPEAETVQRVFPEEHPCFDDTEFATKRGEGYLDVLVAFGEERDGTGFERHGGTSQHVAELDVAILFERTNCQFGSGLHVEVDGDVFEQN